MNIKLGYEIGTGTQVDISLSHLIVCGVTQLSGKTTTLEALLQRGGRTSVVFKTKIGEKSFSGARKVPPFFREDKGDYEFVRSMIEAYSREKLFIEKGTLMELCKGSPSLQEIKTTIDAALVNTKLRAFQKEIYIRLQHYIGNLVSQIENIFLSKILVLNQSCINVMDLEKFSEEVQSLIIQSVINEVLQTRRDTIVVIPEAWKFIPQQHNNPCKRSVESFIRQGAANNNFIWADSQDLAGTDKIPLKQISTYLLGYQSERNEVKHTLDQIPLPRKSKPKEDEIMTLKRGQFFLATSEGVKKVYVQPTWLSDTRAREVAMGVVSIDSVARRGEEDDMYDDTEIRREIEKLKNEIGRMGKEIEKTENRLPLATGQSVNIEEIITRVLERIPTGNQNVVYQVAPLEMIRKKFQEDAKNFVLGECSKIDDDQRKILKFVEAQGKGCNITMIIDKCLHLSATSGGTRSKFSKKIDEMVSLQIIRKDTGHSLFYPNLKEFVCSYVVVHGATESEIQQVYDHIMAGLI